MAYERLKKRLCIVNRAIKSREKIQLDIDTFEHWNRTHPDEEPLDLSDFYEFAAGLDAMLTHEEAQPLHPASTMIAPKSPGVH